MHTSTNMYTKLDMHTNMRNRTNTGRMVVHVHTVTKVLVPKVIPTTRKVAAVITTILITKEVKWKNTA